MATLANRLGVSAELPAVPALVLGSGDVSPLDMAVGYSTFANRGVRNDPILIAKIEQVDDDGDLEVIDQAVPTGERVLVRGGGRPRHLLPRRRSCRTAPAASAELRQAGGRQDRHHPGQQGRLVRGLHARSSPPRCGSGYADPLPDGTVPTMDEDSPVSRSRGLNGVTGGSLPAAIWRKFMVAATEGVDTGSFVAADRRSPARCCTTSSSRPPPPTATSSTSSTSIDQLHDHHRGGHHDQQHVEHHVDRRPRRPRSTTTIN